MSHDNLQNPLESHFIPRNFSTLKCKSVLIFSISNSSIYRSSHRRCSVKKVFLEISRNSQENTCTRVSFLIKLKAPAALLKKRLWQKCFPVNFVKFLRTLFLQNNSGRAFGFIKNIRWRSAWKYVALNFLLISYEIFLMRCNSKNRGLG